MARLVGNRRCVLFVQATDPGAYPPLINAAHIMAHAGWQVTFLAAPMAGKRLSVSRESAITVIDMAERPSHEMSKRSYFDYCRQAIALARKLKPNVIYASDPNGALPGWLASKVSGARLVYHEHDSPSAEADLHPLIRWTRRCAARAAEIVVFPNSVRGRIAQETIRFDAERLQVVWNVPRLAELPDKPEKPDVPLVVWYHGSINPERLPETVLEAIATFDGAIRLRIAGYESPGAKGYIQTLIKKWNSDDLTLISYVGEIEYHEDLLNLAAECHAGLALMPLITNDINMKYMVGASNKPFDYMAAGMFLIVSDLPEWREVYVSSGHSIACDPSSSVSLIDCFRWLMENRSKINEVGKLNREKIQDQWNFESLFKQVFTLLS